MHTKDTPTTTNKNNNSNTNVINISQHTTTTPTTISSANNKNIDDVAAFRASVVDDGQQEEGGQHPQRMDTTYVSNHNNANDQSSGSGNSADSLATESPKAAAADLSNKTDYIHVRARRGQATDSHSLAERVSK